VIWLLLIHLVACAALMIVGDRPGRWVFAVAGAPMLISSAVALDAVLNRRRRVDTYQWVEGLDLTMAVRLDALTSLLLLLVSGIGVLICVYAAGYFAPGTIGIGRFAATLLGFSTAMAGLVVSDTPWTLFVFWELTSITSFLLVGHKRTDAGARTAARRALVITASGGLLLLAGFVAFLDVAPGARLSELEPVTGGWATAAAILILVAAATKSAQVPFHVWLPGAMAAPTPVSAYLHSATMVKAGVVLVAVAAPALGETGVWTPLGVAFGATSMIWGAVGALRQVDAKLIMAWGTVSQLGLMIALLSIGSAKATFAAVAIVLAHALFKATLFMVVGEIDVRTGTRDINELRGLRQSMPLAFVVTIIAAASMAGVPPLLGFPAKEAAVEAALGLQGGERAVMLAVIIGGSILTVAYTTRFVIGVFGSPGKDATVVGPARPMMSAPSVILALATLGGFVALGSVSGIVRDASKVLDPKTDVYALLRWPGLTDAFLVSAGIVIVGIVVGAALAARLTGPAPRPLGADVVDATIDRVVVLARIVAARVQHGSLPGYVLTIVATAALAASPFLWSFDLDPVYGWDNLGQGVLAVFIAGAAIAATRVRTRIGAALVLGAIGFAVTGLFVAHGAPDLVLTQLLVETVVVVGFVVGLGRLATTFPRVGGLWMSSRIVVSALAAGATAVALVASADRLATSPPANSVTDRLAEAAVDEGGGKNIVNVVLTDVRALDTLGEIVVLVVVAVGILALTRRRPDDTSESGLDPVADSLGAATPDTDSPDTEALAVPT
jgi:multicomponent Na+:H+ antiporter subunit A